MATNRWKGDSAPVSQVVTLTVGSATSGHTFVTTINGRSVTYTAGTGETTSTVAAAIQALLAASTAPEFREVTWTVSAAVITGTATTAGKPFTISESGTGTYTLATPTASSGPNHVDLAANWSLGATPGAGDDVLIDGGPDLLYGWENVASAVYGSVRILASFAGRVGLPYRDEDGDYVQYRGRAFLIGTGVAVTIGEGEGSGPTLVNLTIATAANVTVVKTGTRASADVPAVNVAGCGSGTLVVIAGDVGIAADDDTLSATVTTLTTNDDAAVVVGRGATATTANVYGGVVLSRGTIGTLNMRGGEVAHHGTISTAVTADPSPGGDTVFDWRAGGTIGTVTFRGQDGASNPRMTCGNDPRAKTITNGSFTGGASLDDPDNTVVMSNAQTWDRASLSASDLGARFSLLKS
jgi:hypothetical protein